MLLHWSYYSAVDDDNSKINVKKLNNLNKHGVRSHKVTRIKRQKHFLTWCTVYHYECSAHNRHRFLS